MRHLLSIVLLLCLGVLVPTVAWEASVSQNVPITITAADPPGFYVATNGSDSNPGTLAAPFATLVKCQTAMQSSSTKTCYIRGGTYYVPNTSLNSCNYGGISHALILDTADAGETWSYYPPDGVDSAILDGGGTQYSSSGPNYTGTGLEVMICINSGASGVTINGLQLQHYGATGILVDSSGTIINNQIHDNWIRPTDVWAVVFGGIVTRGTATITHNYVYNTLDRGIILQQTSSGSMNGAMVSYNYVFNTCLLSGDCGGIAVEGGPDTATIDHNFVRDVDLNNYGVPQDPDPLGYSIYFDSNSSSFTVTNNVFTGHQGTACVNIGGGGVADTTLKNNICDLGAGRLIVYYQLASSGNVFENNIVLAKGSQGGYYGSGATAHMTISNNAYYNYNGSSVTSSDNGDGTAGSDSNPVYENPQLYCWVAMLASSSPTFASPVSFPAQLSGWGTPGFWGPVGFVIPQTGTAPSWSMTGGNGVTCTSSS